MRVLHAQQALLRALTGHGGALPIQRPGSNAEMHLVARGLLMPSGVRGFLFNWFTRFIDALGQSNRTLDALRVARH